MRRREVPLVLVVVAAVALWTATRAFSYPKPPPWLATITMNIWGPRHNDTANCLAWYESRYKPHAASPTNDHGLWQIHNGFYIYGEVIFNPVFNAVVARAMSNNGRNWMPWYPYRRGLCHGLS